MNLLERNNYLKFFAVDKHSMLIVLIVFVAMFVNSNDAHAQKSEPLIISEEGVYITPIPLETHSPHKATFYSAILPGLGQAYNKKYWKIPILYAGIGGVVYGLDFNTTYYNKYKRAYRDFLILDPANKSYLEFIRPNSGYTEEDIMSGGRGAENFQRMLDNKKKNYKRNRDLGYVGLALIYVLNLVDASVDAHFKTFDVSDDLSMHIEPSVMPMYGGESGLGMQVRFVF